MANNIVQLVASDTMLSILQTQSHWVPNNSPIYSEVVQGYIAMRNHKQL